MDLAIVELLQLMTLVDGKKSVGTQWLGNLIYSYSIANCITPFSAGGDVQVVEQDVPQLRSSKATVPLTDKVRGYNLFIQSVIKY